MTTEATLPAISAERLESSSTAWLWWKETRQLAPLVGLLVIVAFLIVLLNALVGMTLQAFAFRLPYEVTMLVFPGLFATGAGPLLVGQERSQRTMEWLSLLPISARRLATTKLLVALAGLAVMWAFALFILFAFNLREQATSHWEIGNRSGYTNNPFSYPVWMVHSLFVLLSGFYVAWRIKNQFYSLVALIPLAFAPLIMTSVVAAISGRPVMPSTLDWINFCFTVLGVVVMTPLAYRAAMHALGAAPAPGKRSALEGLMHSPAQEVKAAIPPRFATQVAPIIWQSLHAAKGMLVILVGMLVLSLFAATALISVDHLRGIMGMVPILLILAPLAVCWLGVSVFKYDGASERIRFLADRGVSPVKTYVAIQALPVGVLCASLLVYGFWNWYAAGQSRVNDFAAGLPTLITMLMLVLLVYAVSQWVSQFVRTLILAVILAPILATVFVGWFAFAYLSLGVPIFALAICAVVPLLATFVMMRRYMDSRDRPFTFLVGAVVVTVMICVPVGFAVARVLSVPTMDSQLRSSLLAEGRSAKSDQGTPVLIRMYGLDSGRYYQHPPDNSMEELERSFNPESLDPLAIVQPLMSSTSGSDAIATVDIWSYDNWHGEFARQRILWQESQDEAAWENLIPWLKASAVLMPALRRSSLLTDQEVADRLEVMMIDTLRRDVPADRRGDPAVRDATGSLGTPESRYLARRRAILKTWASSFTEDRRSRNYIDLYILENQPPGLSEWLRPRYLELGVMAMLDGIQAARDHASEVRWRRQIHAIHQDGGVFETSRYGDELRSLPAIETMSTRRLSGFGQLWGRDWEYVDRASLMAN